MPTKKLGLALSGGGFRASFFHIGVLARMASLGLLRYVEVISTVSGGSIIGALYYLHVKKLLDGKSIDDIVDDDYIEIVHTIEKDFLIAVQKNFRMRIFLNPWKNIKMLRANYSSSDRIGELYDYLLYRTVLNRENKKYILMKDLKIHPIKTNKVVENEKDGSKRPMAKVPILLINATALNSGHNWRFDEKTMGEPIRKSDLFKQIDKNIHLRKSKSYKDMPPKPEIIKLGIAVAASAGVPAIFPPLAISNLYPDKIRVELVDGGVHDNQGIQGLIDRDCSQFVVSDASGQMNDETNPSTGGISVLSRSSTILSDRVREEQLFGLMGKKSVKWQGAFMHLRKNLHARVVFPLVREKKGNKWLDPFISLFKNLKAIFPFLLGGDNSSSKNSGEEKEFTTNDFNVDPEVQKLLSLVRTDLDSFTDVEAYSLMLDGFLMSESELRKLYEVVKNKDDKAKIDIEKKWYFLSIKPWISNTKNGYYIKQLNVAHERLFKVFRLSNTLKILTILTLALLVYMYWEPLISYFGAFFDKTITYGEIAFLLFGAAIAIFPKLSKIFKILKVIRSPLNFFLRLNARISLAVIAPYILAYHLLIFDNLFLWLGKVKRLGDPPVS